MFKPVSLPLLPVPWIFNGGQKKSLLLGVLPYKEFRQTLRTIPKNGNLLKCSTLGIWINITIDIYSESQNCIKIKDTKNLPKNIENQKIFCDFCDNQDLALIFNMFPYTTCLSI